MTAKITAARATAFLKALAASGNITVSAERAKVSRSWVLKRRGEDAGFDAAVLAALDEARKRLLTDPHPARPGDAPPSPACGRGVNNKPSANWAFVGGVEMVVRGTRCGPRGASGRRVQIGRARPGQWTGRTEERFLAALATSGNVKAACRVVGLCHSSAYGHRRRWPGFAAAWDAVIEELEIALEAAQIECARHALAGLDVPAGNPIREMTFSEAIYLVEMFRRRREGHPRRWGRIAGPAGDPSIEEVRKEVLRKVEVMLRAGRGAGRGGGQ